MHVISEDTSPNRYTQESKATGPGLAHSVLVAVLAMMAWTFVAIHAIKSNGQFILGM